jgi:hypothetical protein
MKGFFSASDFKRYSKIEDLEKVKEYFQKIAENMGNRTYSEVGIRNAPIGYDGVLQIRFIISQIDAEIESRKKNTFQYSDPKGRCAVALISSQNYNQVPPYYGSSTHVSPPIPTHNHSITEVKTSKEIHTLKEQLVKKDKEVMVLRKRLEEASKEVHDERVSSDKYQRIIEKHKCDNGKSFTAEVEEDV